MTKEIVRKHDPLVRKFLTDPRIAKEFLEIHLAPEIRKMLDLNTLRIEPSSYISETLKSSYSDIVYRLNLNDNSGEYAYIYVLIEHQSSVDNLMPFRVVQYQVAIIEKHLTKYGKSADTKLPLVVPIVFYNGTTSPYNGECDIANLFTNRELFDRIQLGKFKLIDLTIIDSDEILKHGKLATLEMLTKHIAVRDFSQVMQYIVNAMIVGYEHKLGEVLFRSAFNYLADARENSEIDAFMEQIIQNKPDFEEKIMTYAECLREEGKQKGIQIGEQKGIQIGKQEGIQIGEQKAQQAIAKELLSSGIDINIVAKATHLSKKEIESLINSLH